MDGTNAYLIDWLTMRLPISAQSHPALFARVAAYSGHIVACDSSGEIEWQKRSLDIEALRSDSPGLYWQLTGDGTSDVLVIGASPASLEHGLNVWGSLDVKHCAEVLIRHASKCLQIALPGLDAWQCRRIDVTANYALPDAASVKHALAQLLVSAGARRRPSSHNRGGDTVYWNPGSDLSKGKAYHKGPQVLHLWKKNKLDNLPENVDLLNQVIRLEHTRGAKWFRRLSENGHRWQDLTQERLIELHMEFFTPLVGVGIEVKNMERVHIIQAIMLKNFCSENQARAAFSTYRNIRQDGYEVTKDSMSDRTFFRHQKMLRNAGISDQHLRDAIVIPFPRVRFVLAKPVANWDEIRRAA
ncbi:phage/plasmid replication protein, II/X family [Thiobacillus sp.]|uniref:phage/plasmid replication protein, II/X family n=1 Tax=Thiobacillus sp. TaxID=924 RepID=UPI00286E56F5|nr:phage/plasmid replication protein, II/X family [Thiobacillus sp.]